MRVLSLDVATETGWSIADDERAVSQTLLGHFRCDGKEPEQKAANLRDGLRNIVKIHGRCDMAVIERPFMMAPQYDKKKRQELVDDERSKIEIERSFLSRIQSAVERHGIVSDQVEAIIKEHFGEEKTINPKTTALLNWMVGAAQSTCEGMGMIVEIVRPQTVRTIFPEDIKKLNVGTKDKVRILCDKWGIIGGDHNARDAAIQGIWCIRKSQVFKKLKNEMQKELL